jgi:hypothetical protein
LFGNTPDHSLHLTPQDLQTPEQRYNTPRPKDEFPVAVAESFSPHAISQHRSDLIDRRVLNEAVIAEHCCSVCWNVMTIIPPGLAGEPEELRNSGGVDWEASRRCPAQGPLAFTPPLYKRTSGLIELG